MKTILLSALASAAIFLTGCVSPRSSAMMNAPSATLFEPLPKEPAPAPVSLFPEDQAVLSDEVVAKILATKLELPAKAKIVLMKFPDAGWGARYYGQYYWRNEQYLKLQQSQVDALEGILQGSHFVSEVNPFPSLMTPKQISISTLRGAAVRMQADLLVIFRITSDTYSQYRTFAKDQAKTYSTCELVLLDIRTGLVPFTIVVSREQTELKQSSDFDLSETIRRAEQESATKALQFAADKLVTFINSEHKSGK